MALQRLQKIIAAAGIASRRKAEEMIQAGLVSVNGATVTELGSKADPETDSIRVQDKLLQGAERHEYFALNKPRGYVTTVSDPEGRPTVMELLRSKARLYPVGRLDFNSEGLLLLTNDGTYTVTISRAGTRTVGGSGNYEMFINRLYQVSPTAAPTGLITYGQRVVSSVDAASKWPRCKSRLMIGSRATNRPTVAGRIRNSRLRIAVAKVARICANSPRALCAAKVGKMAVASACATTPSGSSMIVQA